MTPSQPYAIIYIYQIRKGLIFMKTYYGKSNSGWWYKIEIDGQEVGGKRNLTLAELEEDKKELEHFKWIRDTDTTI